MTSALTNKGSTRKWRTIREQVLLRDGWQCQACGADADTVDHLIPRARGGGDNLENLQAMCSPCNLLKSDKLPGEKSDFFSARRIPRTHLSNLSPTSVTNPASPFIEGN
jgi:5-methylcytosine-specific restriction endonuclease McrA